jgi:hypothetical protein
MHPPRNRKQLASLLVLTIPFLCVGIALIFISAANSPISPVKAIQWFDPVFFQYNVVLLFLLILIIPAITYVYVDTMRQERFVRLQNELPPAELHQHEQHIRSSIEIQFSLRNYVGSTATLMIVIALGFSVMLMLKPLLSADDPGQPGVDYGKGANLLLLGPYIEAFPGDKATYYHRLIVSLTAFQFGFLGAYVFFIGHLLRSYYTLDLTPNTFVSISARMVVSSLIALVVSFALPSKLAPSMIPVVSFFIGFFPSRGLLVIDKISSRILQLRSDSFPSKPLSALSGVSPEHEMRLRREGYDNVDNLAQADAIGLAVRTGCGYKQIKEWIGQAWLWSHMGDDYEAFRSRTGIGSTDDFVRFVTSWRAGKETVDVYSFLESACEAKCRTKIRVIGELLVPSRDRSCPTTGASS